MSPRKFWLLNLFLILVNIKYMLCIRQSSLAFVIDDTFSMQYEIDQVTAAVDSIIDIMDKTNTSEIADIVLVTFNDPDFKLLLKSNSRTDIKRVLGSIKADNGMDCPEMALSGTKLGLEQSLVGSYLYVFTDEYPKDKYLENEVIKICQEKQIQVVFVITPSSVIFCARQKIRDFTPYYNIAKACSGQVFRLSYKQEVPKFLPYVEEIAKGPRTVTSEKTIPANTPSTVEFTIDDETEYAIVSTSGQNVVLRLKSGPTTIYEEIVWINNLKIMKISKAGYYVAEVRGESTTSIVIFGRTDFTFQHGFFDNVPGIFNGSMKQSYEETETNLLILVDDPNRAVQIQSVQILDMVENILLEIPLHQISGNYYASNKFVPPSTTYKIKVIGKAIATGKILPRTSKTPIKPNPKPQSPVITIGDGSKTISVPYNSTLYLVCYVTAYPKPLITWTDKNLQAVSNQNTKSENLTRYINNISVPNIKKGQKYYCSAENKIGSLTKHVQVKVLEPFLVHEQSEANVNAAYGKQATLLCNITSHLPMQIQWFFGESGKDETIIHNSDKYFMSSRNTLLQIKKMDSTLEGTYKCLASLVWEGSKQKMHSIRVTINDLEAPEIDTQHDIITAREHTEVNLKCNTVKGKPAPKITWMFKDRIIASDTDLHIADVTIAESGVYTCIAENVKGRAEHIVKLNVGVAPEIDKQSGVIIRVEENHSVNITCNVVKGNPMPNITWLYKNHTIGTTSLLKLTVVNVADAGDYKCIVKNSVGNDELNIKLDVQVAPQIDKGDAIKTVRENASVTLFCNVIKGNPTAKIIWEFKHHVIGSDTLLNLRDVSIDDAGEYRCIAENDLGSDVHINKLDVEVVPVIDKQNANLDVREKNNITVQCNVIKGNPTPKYTWEFKYHIVGTNQQLNLTDVSLADAGDYKCIAENIVGRDEYIVKLDVGVVPEIDKNISNINAIENQNITLPCNILKGNPQPEVIWEYNNHFVKSDTQLILTKVTLVNAGHYKCIAKNIEGQDEYIINLDVEVIPEIDKHNSMITVVEKKSINLQCNVTKGNPKPSIFWKYKNYVIGYDTPLRLSDVTLASAGDYECVARNIAGQDVHIIKLEIETGPDIDKSNVTAKVREDSSFDIKCKLLKGNPKPTITWIFNNSVISSNSLLHLERVTLADSGDYKCVAENTIDSDQHIFKLDVLASPKIDNSNTIKKVIEYNTAVIQCPILKGNPKPKITWKHKGKLVTSEEELHILNVTFDNFGDYTCRAENSEGYDVHTVKVIVEVIPKIDKLETVINITEKNSVNLHCRVRKGFPKPNITWIFQNRVMGSDEVLSFTNVTVADSGSYKCIAKNYLGADEHILKLDVKGAPKIILLDAKTYHIAVEDDIILLPCEVIGNPKPTRTWLKNGKIINKEDKKYLIANGTLIIKRITIESNNRYPSFVCKAKNEFGEDEKEHLVHITTTVSYYNIKGIIYVLKNSNERLNCSAASSETDYVRWYKNGYFIGTGLHKYITNATTLDDGNYTCRVSNSQGSKNGETLEVIVDAPPTLGPEAYNQQIINWKGGYEIISCRVHIYRLTAMFTWFHNGKIMPKEHNEQLYITTSGNYTCKVSNYFGEVEDHFQITSTDCLIDMTASYAANWPLILTKTSKLPSFITREHYMIIPSGMPLKLSCDKFQKFSNSKEIDVICLKEDQFVRIEDNSHFKFSDLYCSKEITPKLQITGTQCSGQNTEIVKIGFQVQDFTEVYETCYDTVEKLPLYTKIYIHNPKFQIYKDDDFYENKYVYGSFSSGNIKTGYKTGHTKCSYVQGQLVNAEDIIYGVAQTAALLMHDLNNVKYFSCVNQENWKHLSDSIRRYLINSRDDSGLMIWSGTSHWQKKSGISIPRYLWKVVKSLGSEQMKAIVYINAPFPTASDKLCGNSCQDLFIEISDWQTYCCEVSDFANAFNISENVFQ